METKKKNQIINRSNPDLNKKFLQGPGAVFIKRAPGRRRHSKITIDRLNIRLKGISSQAAREVVKGLGEELLHHLARQQVLSKSNSGVTPAKIDTVNAGTVKLDRSGEAVHRDIPRKIAARVSDAIGPGRRTMHLGSNQS